MFYKNPDEIFNKPKTDRLKSFLSKIDWVYKFSYKNL